jgi:hypothetical protein
VFIFQLPATIFFLIVVILFYVNKSILCLARIPVSHARRSAAFAILPSPKSPPRRGLYRDVSGFWAEVAACRSASGESKNF